jgi:hypothetical protein
MDRKILKELRLGDCVIASTYTDEPLYIDRITEYSVHCHTKNKTKSYLVNYEEIDCIERMQPQWKPSDEQMAILYKYAEQNNYDGSILTSLYNELKKLREE